MPETIDSLTLDIGLSSEEFQSGVNKILGSMERMGSTATETGEGMAASFASLGSSVASLVWRFTSLFLAFKSVEGLVDYFINLQHELRDLGYAAEYLGTSGAELRRFGEVAELSGGKAQDAISAVQGLNAAIFGLEYQGQVSQSLVMLNRMGVKYTDEHGNPLPTKDTLFNAAKRLHERFPDDKTQTSRRVWWAQQMFPGAPGISNAVGGPLKEFEDNYKKATASNKDITDKLIDQQKELGRHLTDVGYGLEDNAAVMLGTLTPAIDDLVGAIKDLTPALKSIAKLFEWAQSIWNAGDTGKMLDDADKWLGDKAADAMSWLGGKAADVMYAGRKDRLAAIQIPPKVAARLPSGVNLDALKLLHMEAGGSAGDSSWSKALVAYDSLKNPAGYVAQGMSSGQLTPEFMGSPWFTGGGRTGSPWFSGAELGTPGAKRPPAVGAAGSKPTSSTLGPRLNIGSMTINTQATDANRMASDVNRAIERKFLVAQSDPGLA